MAVKWQNGRMATEPESSSFQRGNAMDLGADSPAVTPMPPEFQLKHPRRVRWSGWYEQPKGGMAHFIGFKDATPEEEAWHRINAPERGLEPEDRIAYRKSQRGPVGKFLARLKFWPSKAKDEWDFEVPACLRNLPD